MTPKDFIEQLKDYADIADASYAMLHYVDENEKIDYRLDELKSNSSNEKVKPPARWVYADGINIGYEIKDKHLRDERIKNFIDKNKRELGQPTAYALAIEARFSQDMMIETLEIDKKTNKNEKKAN